MSKETLTIEPKTERWPIFSKNRIYPPTSPPYPIDVTREVIKAVEHLEEGAGNAYWLKPKNKEQIDQLKLLLPDLSSKYLASLNQFKKNDDTYDTARSKAINLLNASVEANYEKGPEMQKLIDSSFMNGLIIGLEGTQFIDEWMNYYEDPNKEQHLPVVVQDVTHATQRYLLWAALEHADPNLKGYSNPFLHEYDFYESGIYRIAFVEPADSNSHYLSFKVNENNCLAEIKLPLIST